MKKDTKKTIPEEISKNAKAIQDTFSDLSIEKDIEVSDEETEQIYCIPLQNLTKKLKESPKEIYETEEIRLLTNQLFEHLYSKTINYCILSGDYSVGKTTIVENMVQKIISKKAPASFWMINDFQFLEVDAKDLINLDDEILINSIVYAVDELYKIYISDIVIVIKHLEYLSKEILNAFHKIYSIIENLIDEHLNLKFIFTVNESFWDTTGRYAFFSNSVVKTVKMPKFHDLYYLLQPKVKELQISHGCTISKEMLKFLLTLTMSNENGASLKTYIFFIDLVLTRVELANRKEVTIEDIYKNFEDNFKDWKSLPEQEKARIAYHEAGHTVFGLIALSNYYQLLAVTSIPSMNLSSLGATIEFFKTHLYNVDKKMLKKFLAFYLAGRESEFIAGYKRNNGAKSDLNQMSSMLVDTIASTGLFKNCSSNYAYDLEGFISEKAIFGIETEAKRFSKKAAKYAKKVLNENWKLVEIIANRLISDGLISGAEVEKIYKKYLKKSKKK